MEEQIKRAVRNLNISYIFFWVLPAFLLGAGEFELLPVGSLADNAQAVYYFETLGILLTALCIPLSIESMFPYNDTRQNHSDDVRNAQTFQYNRSKQDDDQHKEKNPGGVSDGKIYIEMKKI